MLIIQYKTLLLDKYMRESVIYVGTKICAVIYVDNSNN